LLREDQYNEGFYHSIDIDSIRTSLTWVFQESYPRIAVSDFLVLGFFVGNDFLPKIPMFLLLEDGLNFMIDARRRLGRSLTTSNGTIDIVGFTRFVNSIAGKESRFLERQATRKMPASRFVNHTLLRSVERGTLDYGLYRSAYYKKAGADSQSTIDEMCRDYLQGILWVCAYYLQGLPSWEWCYTWHYAPLLGDLADYLSRESFSDIPRFVKGKPSLPFVQLLSVLPPQSSGLLPEPYRKLMVGADSPLVAKGVYPDSFSIDYEGKTKDHMGVALLSFVERDTIIEAYNTIERAGLGEKNKTGVPVRFWVDPSFVSRFVSPFGSVQRNRVRREKMLS
jgi:5'-3' exonuclease